MAPCAGSTETTNLLAPLTRGQLEEEIVEQGRLAADLARDVIALRKCLSFFASVIKSGEPWTATCESEYRKAMQNV